MIKRPLKNISLVLGFALLMMAFAVNRASAQCATPISIFPYTQGFESNNGGWFTGGTLSDWAWGTPSKPIITGAAAGAKCWIAGGLTLSRYNDGELSWLQSPCFDFTSLQYPYISFAVFWETERRFDGANFQYSTNLGVTWTNVGAATDPVDCLNANWFNFSPITYLNGLATVRDGWSGTTLATAGSCQGGGGSGQWVAAQHTMPNLAGVPNVIFRFTFGAGTQCNAYDGFAVDEIVISNAPPNNASFTYTCSNNNTIDFTNTSDLCPATTWDFGDPASGANNTSTLANPSHTFSAPGIYTVTLTATGPGNASSVYTQDVKILGLSLSGSNQVSCFGDKNGTATVNVVPATAAPFSYAWNTTPTQNTQTISGLGAGSYTVTVSAANSCNATATAIITEPSVLSHTVSITQPGCTSATGTATITETGGTAPYSYSWSPYGGNAATATSLTPGSFTVTVTDSKSCVETINITIVTATQPTAIISNKKDASCPGQNDGTATVTATGGNGPYTYRWNTVPVQNTATAKNLKAGNYSVTVTDNNGCIATTSVQINEPVSGACGEVFFPNAFSPNGDGVNETFGPLGNLAAVSKYQLYIYNRYGEMVFSSNDPYRKWNGLYKSKLPSSGSYVWTASYTYKSQSVREEKGSVTIIR